jgi:general secretion pathway protein K
MQTPILKNNHGIALLIVLTVVTLLVTTALELNRRARSSVTATMVLRDQVTLTQMASSVIQLAMAILVKDKNESEIDTVQEDWADPEKIADFLSVLNFDAGKVTVTIQDERAKVQINALVQFPEGKDFNEPQRFLWDRLLEAVIDQDSEALEDIDPVGIINSVKDWLDANDNDAITGLTGAESDYYEGLEQPYPCKNGPFSHLDELANVKGITTEFLNGFGGVQGLAGYITVYGATDAGNTKFTYDGKININTADLPVIVALLPEGNEEFAMAIYEYRQEKSDELFVNPLNGGWYMNCPGCKDSGIKEALVTTTSDIFQIQASATLHNLKTTVIAVVRREKEKKSGKYQCKILSWQTQ